MRAGKTKMKQKQENPSKQTKSLLFPGKKAEEFLLGFIAAYQTEIIRRLQYLYH